MARSPTLPRLRDIRYGGPLILDSAVPGEGRRDFAIMNVVAGIQVAPRRWLYAINTADRRGCDANRAILYQLRADAPDGPILREGAFVVPEWDLDPAETGHRFWHGASTPKLFGVPKGTRHDGAPLPHANQFVLIFSSKIRLQHAGRLVQPVPNSGWPDSVPLEAWQATRQAIFTGMEWLQFRLNNGEDDIEITVPRERLDAGGCPAGVTAVPGTEPWCIPVQATAAGDTWYQTAFQDIQEDRHTGHAFRTLAYTFDPAADRYRWTAAGAVTPLPEIQSGEPSLIRLADNDWVIAVRAFDHEGVTLWYRTSDPLGHGGQPTTRPGAFGQRVAARCSDGIARLFINDRQLSPYHERRNPLYAIDVNPDGFVYGPPRVVADAHSLGLPFHEPFLDHVTLLAADGARQILPFRAITSRHIWNHESVGPETTPAEDGAAGIYYAELRYDRSVTACCPKQRTALGRARSPLRAAENQGNAAATGLAALPEMPTNTLGNPNPLAFTLKELS